MTVYGAISEALGEEIDADTDWSRLHRLCDRAGRAATRRARPRRRRPGDVRTPGRGEDPAADLLQGLPDRRLPAHPPAPRDPRLAERWDLVAFGTELGTAYSELTDPVEQRRRLTAQSLLAAGGDPEAMELDEDFLDALEYAMPPTGGLGIGVDRLVMFLTGLTIRETLPFPLVRRR